MASPIEIYYFSGTGNSRYVAKQLQEKLPQADLLPVVSHLHKATVNPKATCIGFIFPVHALTIPIVVKNFLKKIDLRNADYLFAVATRGGTFFRGFELIDRLLKRQHKKLHASFLINMGNNDPRGIDFRSISKAEKLQIEEKLEEKLVLISNTVKNIQLYRTVDSEYLEDFPYNPWQNYLLEKLVLFGMTISEFIGGVNYFYADDKCNGCGICEKVCLSTKIKLTDRMPVWQKETFCYMCYACINFCPQQAIQINSIPGVKSFTEKNVRYSHPYATVKDIQKQKG